MIKTQQLSKVALGQDVSAQTNLVIEEQGVLGRLPASVLREGYATVAALKAAAVSEGQTVTTRGYGAENDGGGAVYIIRAAGAEDTDGAATLLLENGLCAELMCGGTVNVKQFGAVGDGKQNDGPALRAAFAYAVAHTPCEVFFPRGEYGLLSGGIQVTLPLGGGGLTVRGEGGEASVIKYLPEWRNDGTWVALRFLPERTPADEGEYLHDIVVRDLGVVDSDPEAHAWSEANGDAGTEETHGFDITYCHRAKYLHCKISSVGDEALDMTDCIDSVIEGCHVIGSPGAGNAGGAISVGDGCRGVSVNNNTVNGSIADKENFGIAIEALLRPVSNVSIFGNIITDIAGNGINISAVGNSVFGVSVIGNTIDGCTKGIVFASTGEKEQIVVGSNSISNVSFGIWSTGITGLRGLNVNNNCIDTCALDGIFLTGLMDAQLNGNVLRNIQRQAILISEVGDGVQLNNTLIDGAGLDGSNPMGVVQSFEGVLHINNMKILNCRALKAIYNATSIVDAQISMTEAAGNGRFAIDGGNTRYVRGGKLNGAIAGLADNGSIEGVTIETTVDIGTQAITLNNRSGCVVTGCHIITPQRYSIREMGTSNKNIITGNRCSMVMELIGSATVNQNNIIG